MCVLSWKDFPFFGYRRATGDYVSLFVGKIFHFVGKISPGKSRREKILIIRMIADMMQDGMITGAEIKKKMEEIKILVMI